MMQTLTLNSSVEAVGYGGRAYSSSETPDWTLVPYMLQTMLILLGPAFYAASIYMVLGRLIRLLGGEEYSLVRLKWLTKLFLLGDILSILAQGGGTFQSFHRSANLPFQPQQ